MSSETSDPKVRRARCRDGPLDADFPCRHRDMIGSGVGRRGDYAYIHVARVTRQWVDLCTTL